MMLEGDRPPECYKCWDTEDRGQLSERVFKTGMYEETDLDAIPLTKWDDDTFLRTLEVSFDRACNFACSYCNPAFSSTWVKDIKTHGPYENLQSDGRGHFDSSAQNSSQLFGYGEFNPYVEAFWKWWDSGLAQNS